MNSSNDFLCFSTNLANESPYYFGHDITSRFVDVLNKYSYDKIYFVTNKLLYELYGREFVCLFQKNNIEHKVIIINDGEENKNFKTLESLCDTLVDNNVSKSSIIIAFGGGCLGNIVGLAAGLVFRGIKYIEIPTTLMSITDSTLSNKQAVNGRNGKNQFGFYYAPIFIWGDIKYLRSEKLHNVNAALVEGVKNGLISNPELLNFFDRIIKEHGVEYTPKDLHEIAYEIIKSKLEILKRDPSEKGYGMTLEYGHTFGHAIEWITKGRIIHGMAVAIGMCIAAELSYRLNFITRDDVDKHYYLLQDKLGLDLSIPNNISADDIMNVIMTDNKKVAKGVKYVLLKEMGECCNPDGDYQVSVESDIVKQVLSRYMEQTRKEELIYA